MFPIIGFSLVEVLITLSIFSVSTLGLFKHQWQQSKSFNTYQIQRQVQNFLDDASEMVLAEFEIPAEFISELETKVHGKFQLKTLNDTQTISIYFSSNDQGLLKSYVFTRTL